MNAVCYANHRPECAKRVFVEQTFHAMIFKLDFLFFAPSSLEIKCSLESQPNDDVNWSRYNINAETPQKSFCMEIGTEIVSCRVHDLEKLLLTCVIKLVNQINVTTSYTLVIWSDSKSDFLPASQNILKASSLNSKVLLSNWLFQEMLLLLSFPSKFSGPLLTLSYEVFKTFKVTLSFLGYLISWPERAGRHLHSIAFLLIRLPEKFKNWNLLKVVT